MREDAYDWVWYLFAVTLVVAIVWFVFGVFWLGVL